MDYYKPIVISREVREIFDHFSYSFHIRTVLFDPTGNVIISGLGSSDSHFCSLIKSTPTGREKCRLMDENMQKKALSSGQILLYPCHAGLMEAVCPLRVHGRHSGFAMLGQIRRSKENDRSLSDRYDHDLGKGKLDEAFKELPYYTDKELGHILGLFRPLVDYIMKNEYIQSRNNLVVEQTLKCIKECEDQETLSIDQIASAMHRSPSSITHILKQQTGFSFKQLHIDYRLRLAEDLMRKRFDLTLQEIAQMAGFNDPFYFSRIYKKYRGYPPSRFRSRG